MHKQLEQRLTQLRAEFAAGQQRLADLERQQASLQQTLLRISGAIQVLEEELAHDTDTAASPVPFANGNVVA